jgi:hypothetical protein
MTYNRDQDEYRQRRQLRLRLIELVTLRSWGELTDEQYAELDELVTTNPVARELYFEVALDTATLGSQAAPWRVARDSKALDVAISTSESMVKPPRHTFVPVFLKTTFDCGFHTVTAARFSLAALLIVGAVCIAGTFSYLRGWRDTAQAPTEGKRPNVPQGEFVATLVGTAEGYMDSAFGFPGNGSRLPASEVRLDGGVAEIVFDSGAKVILQGPAKFTPQSSHGGLLHYGRLVANVPPHAGAFAVLTPVAAVAGRASEFAVRAEESEDVEVHVFRGLARVASRNGNSSGMEYSEVSVGEALCIRSDIKSPAPALVSQPDFFVRDLPTHQLRFPASLVAYWAFDEEGGPVIDQRGNNHGVLQGASRVPGLIGSGALEFSNSIGQLVDISTDEDIYRFSDGISIEAVIVSRWDGEYRSYDEIIRKDDNGGCLLLAFQNDSDFGQASPPVAKGPVLSFGAFVGGVYQELDMPLDGEEGRPRLRDLTDGKPHHIVAQYESRTGEKAIFIDGVFRFGTHAEAGAKINTGGWRTAMIGSSAGWENFNGIIDELALYNAPLTRDEILKHWKNVQSGRSYFELPVAPSGGRSSI